MHERDSSDFLTDAERASGGIDHGQAAGVSQTPSEGELVASQAEQYNSNSPIMHKTIAAVNPPPHDDLSSPPGHNSADDDSDEAV